MFQEKVFSQTSEDDNNNKSGIKCCIPLNDSQQHVVRSELGENSANIFSGKSQSS